MRRMTSEIFFRKLNFKRHLNQNEFLSEISKYAADENELQKSNSEKKLCHAAHTF